MIHIILEKKHVTNMDKHSKNHGKPQISQPSPAPKASTCPTDRRCFFLELYHETVDQTTMRDSYVAGSSMEERHSVFLRGFCVGDDVDGCWYAFFSWGRGVTSSIEENSAFPATMSFLDP